jgi:SAM-dependent methyltransferase
MLELAKSRGAAFSGRRVLDVGCGSGMFTLRIAKEAAHVTGLDLSGRMLAISAADAASLGLANVDYVQSAWLDYELKAPFDVVFCSMCPAMSDDRAKAKLLEAAGEALIFIGFAEYFTPRPIADLIDYYKLERKSFKSGPEMSAFLDSRGEIHERHPRKGDWTNRHTRESGAAWCRAFLEDIGQPDPDPAIIERSLAPFWDEASQSYAILSPYSVEMIIWRPGAKA